MRILSQEGLQIQDLPYERTRVYLEKDGITVKGLFDGIIFELAKYSTKSKARNAMEMLREQYARLCSLSTYLHGGMELFAKSISQTQAEDFSLEYINMNVFQFPSDDEVEA